MEISISELTWKSSQEEWFVECVEESTDEFWRVGELIVIRNKDTSGYLCAHKKKLREND